MTTIADATDNATVEQLTQAVAGLQETVENLQNTAEQQAKTIDHQDKRIDDLEAELKDELKSELRAELKDEVMAEVEALRDRVDMQSDLIHDLKAELDNQSNNVSGAFAKLSAIDDRLEALEEGEAQVSQGDPSDPDQSHETPLEQVCSLPENVAQSELTANQERARFVAKDVTDYAQSVPAGYRIDTTTMRKVLSANPDENATIHRTTTKRVMNFLDRFGGEEVTIRKQRDGRNSVVFSEDLVERLERSGVCNGESTNGALLTA